VCSWFWSPCPQPGREESGVEGAGADTEGDGVAGTGCTGTGVGVTGVGVTGVVAAGGAGGGAAGVAGIGAGGACGCAGIGVGAGTGTGEGTGMGAGAGRGFGTGFGLGLGFGFGVVVRGFGVVVRGGVTLRAGLATTAIATPVSTLAGADGACRAALAGGLAATVRRLVRGWRRAGVRLAASRVPSSAVTCGTLRSSPAIATPTASLPARATRPSDSAGCRSSERSHDWPIRIETAVSVAMIAASRSGRTASIIAQPADALCCQSVAIGP
jgi:hypothetical protein